MPNCDDHDDSHDEGKDQAVEASSPIRDIVQQIQRRAETVEQAEAEGRGITVEEWRELRDGSAARIRRERDEVTRRLAEELPPLYRRMTFASFHPVTEKQTIAKAALEEWAHAYHELPDVQVAGLVGVGGVLLSGAPGRGKTHLAVALMQEVASPMCRARLVGVPDLLARMRSSFADRDGSGEEYLDSAMTADILVVDDLGAERETEFAIETLYRLIDHRMTHELPTIVTTNLDVATFSKRADGKFSRGYRADPIYGQRIYSRIRGHVGDAVYVIDGEDYRAHADGPDQYSVGELNR